MANSYYKGYWMVTNRCNLRCSYCVLEDAPHQLKAELDLESKKELVTHLYQNLGFRRLTLSGGEVIIFGKHPPKECIELLRHIRKFRSNDSKQNLAMELYTNGTYLSEEVVNEMTGVIDTVAITIDSTDDSFLTNIGRNFGRYKDYYNNVMKGCSFLSKAGIEVKFHSVISTKNHELFYLPRLTILLIRSKMLEESYLVGNFINICLIMIRKKIIFTQLRLKYIIDSRNVHKMLYKEKMHVCTLKILKK